MERLTEYNDQYLLKPRSEARRGVLGFNYNWKGFINIFSLIFPRGFPTAGGTGMKAVSAGGGIRGSGMLRIEPAPAQKNKENKNLPSSGRGDRSGRSATQIPRGAW